MVSSLTYCDMCGAANLTQATHCFACNSSLHPLSPIFQAGSIVNGPLAPAYLLHQRYSIVSQVGTGGFGAVYKALDTLFSNRHVAIKEVNQDGLTPQELAEATANFQREVLLLADLSHPNLPRIHDQFAEGGRSYVVMDFIEGNTLEDYLDKVAARYLPVEEVLDIGLQLCSVLDYLHSRQPPIIFRDLKPANVMRTPTGHVYLIDFGIARHFKPGKAKDTIPLGSKGYAAPEQYGKAQSTPQSDMYGLGATLHELLTGDDPSLTPFRFAPVHLFKSPISAQLDTLLKEMVDMEMSKRPASMAVVRQQLQDLLAQQTVKKLSPMQRSSPALTRQGRGRRNLVIVLAGLAAVGGSAAATGYVLQSLAAAVHSLRVDTTSPSTVTATPSVAANSTSLATPLYTYRGHEGTVTAVAWSPNGQQIASAAAVDDTVQVWNAATGENIMIYTPGSNATEVRGSRRIPVAPTIFATGQQRVDVLAWSPDGTRLSSALGNDTVQIWDVEMERIVFTYSGNPGNANALAWSPDGKRIASISGDSTVQVWSATTGSSSTSYTEYTGHSGAVLTLAWSPNGKWIASGGVDSTVQIWDPATSSRLLTYRGHSHEVVTVAWSPDGKWIASGGVDSTVQIWDPAEGNRTLTMRHSLFTYGGHSARVNAVVWSPDSRRIASGGADATVQVWSIVRDAKRPQGLSLQGNVLIYRGHADQIVTITWSPDGKRIASGGADATVQVWQPDRATITSRTTTRDRPVQ